MDGAIYLPTIEDLQREILLLSPSQSEGRLEMSEMMETEIENHDLVGEKWLRLKTRKV